MGDNERNSASAADAGRKPGDDRIGEADGMEDRDRLENTEQSYRSRRSQEMGDADEPNPFISAMPKGGRVDAKTGSGQDAGTASAPTHPADAGDADKGKPADNDGHDTASVVESLERKPENDHDAVHNANMDGDAGIVKDSTESATVGPGRHQRHGDHVDESTYADEVGEALSDASAEEGRNHIQLWLGLALGLAIAGMSPILLMYMLLTFGAHVGIIAYLAAVFFIPLVAIIVVAVEMATRPKLRRGSSGVTTIILLVLVAAIVILYAFAAYKVGNEITAVVVDTLHRLGNMIIFR